MANFTKNQQNFALLVLVIISITFIAVAISIPYKVVEVVSCNHDTWDEPCDGYTCNGVTGYCGDCMPNCCGNDCDSFVPMVVVAVVMTCGTFATIVFVKCCISVQEEKDTKEALLDVVEDC